MAKLESLTTFLSLVIRLILHSRVQHCHAEQESTRANGQVKWQRHVPPSTASGPWGEFWRNSDPQTEGWIRSPDDPHVQELRSRLEKQNCIRGLEILSPSMHNYTSHAAYLFYRDGFVVVQDVLSAAQLSALRNVSDYVLGKISEIDPDGSFGGGAGKLPYRYSLGDASGTRAYFHLLEVASLIDLPTTTPVLREIFASDDYQAAGAGGDVALAGAIEYQSLHLDAIWGNLGVRPQELEVPPVVTINFAVQDVTAINGPMRKVRGSHRWTQPPPDLAHEPAWMKRSTLCPLKAGSAIFRDNRCWHGGTPNLSDDMRSLPNVEFFAPTGLLCHLRSGNVSPHSPATWLEMLQLRQESTYQALDITHPMRSLI